MDYWMVIKDGFIVYKDSEGEIWQGGTGIFVPVFKNRRDAINLAIKVKKDKRMHAGWTKTVKVKIS